MTVKTRILTPCADVEAALRRYNREGITKWDVILERLKAEAPPIVIKYGVFVLSLARITKF